MYSRIESGRFARKILISITKILHSLHVNISSTEIWMILNLKQFHCSAITQRSVRD